MCTGIASHIVLSKKDDWIVNTFVATWGKEEDSSSESLVAFLTLLMKWYLVLIPPLANCSKMKKSGTTRKQSTQLYHWHCKLHRLGISLLQLEGIQILINLLRFNSCTPCPIKKLVSATGWDQQPRILGHPLGRASKWFPGCVTSFRTKIITLYANNINIISKTNLLSSSLLPPPSHASQLWSYWIYMIY
jgi:hypothetical protein